jgi:hypothetical protein
VSNSETSAKQANSRSHPLLESTAERVQYVADLMAANAWNERTSRRVQRELSAAWGVEPSTVRNYSAEAGRAIKSAIVERLAASAQRAMDNLERIASIDIMKAPRNIPGLAGAVVDSNKAILKMTGFAEPDEDKFRPTTLVQLGQVVTSPVLSALLSGGKKQHVNGKEQSQGRHALGVAAEDADELPKPRRH